MRITREVEHHTSRYLYTVTMINILMGLSIGVGMYLIGLPNSLLWGVMAGFLVFLPYIGASDWNLCCDYRSLLDFSEPWSDTAGAWNLHRPGSHPGPNRHSDGARVAFYA